MSTSAPATTDDTTTRTTDITNATRSTTMKAITRDRFGAPELLRFTDIEIPTPGPGELLVRVHAAGVNHGDALELRGWPYVARAMGHGLRRPKRAVLGTDVAGTVVATRASGFDVGDEIVGWATGAFAEYAVVDVGRAVHRPAGVDELSAAATPTAGVTAWQAVHDVAQVEAGQRVLVIGASGGVGSFVVQLARSAGASVTAVVGTRNVELARSLGATEVIDHRRTEVIALHQHFDTVIDLAGSHRLSDLRRLLTRRGTLVVVGGQDPQSITGMQRFAGAAIRSPFTTRRLVPLFATQDRDALDRLMSLVESGEIRPVVGRTYDLSDTAGALAQIETGHTTGKIVVTVG